MAAPQPQLDYAANVEKYAPTVDATAVQGIVKYLGIALHNRDSSLVAASDPQELKLVRESFMKKKLGLIQTDAELDAAIKDVMTTMSGERNKSRVTVYYLLAEKFGKLGLFASTQAPTTMQPTKGSVPIRQPASGDIERIQHLYEAIARRAFEIFESRGRWIGNELGDWFRAESELLHPVHLELTETDDALGVRSEVPGFEAQELEISVEPRRLMLWGNREARKKIKKLETIYSESCAHQIMRWVELPADVDVSKTSVTLEDGILSIELPKATGTARSQFGIPKEQQEKTLMPVRNARELFVLLLSEARQKTQLSAKIYSEISQQAQDPDIKEALETRVWIVEKDLSAIDRCFELMGEKPVQLSGHFQELLVEDFRKELKEIENPAAKAIFLLTAADRVNHARIAEYEGLVEAADVSGHYAIGLLLESCLADKLVFIERTRRFIRNLVATKVAARVGA